MTTFRLPITVLKIICGAAMLTENGSWAAKHVSVAGEKVSWVAEKVAQAAQSVAHYSKEAAKGVKNFNSWVEERARKIKEDYQRAIAIREAENRTDYYLMPGSWGPVKFKEEQLTPIEQSSFLEGGGWKEVDLNAPAAAARIL